MPVCLALASLSARMLAEAARADGLRPVALDVFGDADTRRAAEAWLPIGDSARLAIDGHALLAALRQLRSRGLATGWVAGSGFEGLPELLAEGERILPLIGNSPEAVARVRRPAEFFGRLNALGIPYPETGLTPPPSPAGWLRKDAGSCGGWAVQPLTAAEGQVRSVYYQRMAPGLPMSALFLADGRRSRLLGINRQMVCRLGHRPYVFSGCIGPVSAPPALGRQLAEWLDALVADFGLRGLNGLDFLLDGERPSVLELNPRPPASLALYRGALMRGHLAASLGGRLPKEKAERTGPQRGFEVLFAPRSCHVDSNLAAALGRLAWCHDIPFAPLRLARGEPLCTVAAEAGSPAAVRRLLWQRRQRISSLLENNNGIFGKSCQDEVECQ